MSYPYHIQQWEIDQMQEQQEQEQQQQQHYPQIIQLEPERTVPSSGTPTSLHVDTRVRPSVSPVGAGPSSGGLPMRHSSVTRAVHPHPYRRPQSTVPAIAASNLARQQQHRRDFEHHVRFAAGHVPANPPLPSSPASLSTPITSRVASYASPAKCVCGYFLIDVSTSHIAVSRAL